MSLLHENHEMCLPSMMPLVPDRPDRSEDPFDQGTRRRFPSKRFDSKAPVYFEGERSRGVFWLRDGIVKLVLHLPNGRARIVRLQGPGTVFGLAGLPGQSPVHRHSAIAVEDAGIELVPRSYLAELRRKKSERYLSLVDELGRQIRQADRWIAEFSTGAIRHRVARLLAYLDELQDKLPPGEIHLMTCQEMGEVLGVTPESVSRVIAELKRDRILCCVASDSGVERHRCDRKRLAAIGTA